MSSVEIFAVLIIFFLGLKQAPGMEELVWEQYTVNLQKVSSTCVSYVNGPILDFMGQGLCHFMSTCNFG